MPAEEEKDRVSCSLFFQKVCMPVYNLQKLSPHLPLLRVTARLFSMFTRPCQVSSQFMVGHNCISSLCFFSALRNLLSILKSSTHNLFFLTVPRILQTPPLLLLSSPLRLASSRVVAKDTILEGYTVGFLLRQEK